MVGLVALLKTNNLLWSPIALAFAMMTTVDIFYRNGKPFLAQQLSNGTTPMLAPTTTFNMGSGAFNINVAFNPQIVFYASKCIMKLS